MLHDDVCARACVGAYLPPASCVRVRACHPLLMYTHTHFAVARPNERERERACHKVAIYISILVTVYDTIIDTDSVNAILN